MKDKRPQFIPGYLAAVARTPIITAGELPGGGDLFRTCTRAVVEHQLALELPALPGRNVTTSPVEPSEDFDDTTPEDEPRACPVCGRAVSVSGGRLNQHGPALDGEFLCPGGGL